VLLNQYINNKSDYYTRWAEGKFTQLKTTIVVPVNQFLYT